MWLKALLLIGITSLISLFILDRTPATVAPARQDKPVADLESLNSAEPDQPAEDTPPNEPVIMDIAEPPMDILDDDIPPSLTQGQDAYLRSLSWPEWVDGGVGVWVSVDEQVLRVIQDRAILFQVPCATARNGVGSLVDSLKTPLGWHSIAKKLGENAPWGKVFRSRRATDKTWKTGDETSEDLVLTRILLLDGEEPGLNKGGNVDSMARYIYIHGTNDEANIGSPTSHGCIRLRNDDVIRAFEIIPTGAKVIISYDGEA